MMECPISVPYHMFCNYYRTLDDDLSYTKAGYYGLSLFIFPKKYC